jgi:proteasome assembly chaperone (PAC2) family protein
MVFISNFGESMKKPYFRYLFKPVLEYPIFIHSVSGFGNVGNIAGDLLIKFCNAKPFTELYSPSFPDYISIDSNGICSLPRYCFFSAEMEKKDFIIMTGTVQPALQDSLAYYELCRKILDFVEKFNCKFIITLEGMSILNDTNKIYVAATSSRIADDFKKMGATIFNKNQIIGTTGLMLGLAKERGINGVCLLGATIGFQQDHEAGLSVFNFLIKALDIKKKTKGKE